MSKIDLVRTILTQLEYETKLRTSFEGILSQMINASEITISPEKRIKILNHIVSRTLTPEFIEDVTKIYSDSFDDDELQSIVEFNDSPLGKSIIEKTPRITALVDKLTHDRMSPAMPTILEEIQNILDEGDSNE